MKDSDKKQVDYQNVRLHISYNENLTFNEFSILMNSINLAFNDVNREAGIISAKELNALSPIIVNFDKGSILLDVIIPFLVGVSINVVSSAITNRILRKKQKNIDIHIEKFDDKGRTLFDIHVKK